MVIAQIKELNAQGIGRSSASVRSRHSSIHGVGFFIIDHRISELKEAVLEYFLLENGKIAFQGTSEAFFRDEMVKEVFLG